MSKGKTADVVICGAGVAGIATAYHLVVRQGVKKVVLVDDRPPLTLTSDKSTECYRNWWPGPGSEMVQLMNRSIDLLEALAQESDNYFHMNRRGYIFLTADPQQARQIENTAREISSLGAGPLRYDNYQPAPTAGFAHQPNGADFVAHADRIRQHYPFLTEGVVAMLHCRRCGWLSGQQLGMYLLQQIKAHGGRLLKGRVTGVERHSGQVHTVHVQTGQTPSQIQTRCFVNAAGPYVSQVGQLLDVEIPVYNELHGKIAFNDYLGIVPRDVPLMIWNDPVTLPWSDRERQELAANEETRWLLQPFPAGVHFRPEGGPGSQVLLMLWTYHLEPQDPIWPPHPFDDAYPEITLRGLTRMIPGLSVYFDKMPKPEVDGGYYCKTQENRPLACPLPVTGAYLIGALSGYGIMACMGVGELVSAYITGSQLPDYAPAFHLDRYQDPHYQQLLAHWDTTAGQL